MIETLTKELIRIKNEILDLKTAHKHGLGSMRLFTYDITPSGTAPSGRNKDLAITLEVASDAPAYPLINMIFSNYNDVATTSLTITDGGRRYEFAAWGDQATKLRILSSSPLGAINAEWEP